MLSNAIKSKARIDDALSLNLKMEVFWKINKYYLYSLDAIKTADLDNFPKKLSDKFLSEFDLWETNQIKYTLTSKEIFDLERFMFLQRERVRALFHRNDEYIFDAVESLIGSDYSRAKLSEDATFPYYMLTISKSQWTYLRTIIDMMREYKHKNDNVFNDLK